MSSQQLSKDDFKLVVNEYYRKRRRHICRKPVRKLTRSNIKELLKTLNIRNSDIAYKRNVFSRYSFLKWGDSSWVGRYLTATRNELQFHERRKITRRLLMTANIVQESRYTGLLQLKAEPAPAFVEQRIEKRQQMAQIRLEDLKEKNDLGDFFRSITTTKLSSQDVAINMIAWKILLEETLTVKLVEPERKKRKTDNGQHINSELVQFKYVILQHYFSVVLQQCEIVLNWKINEDVTLAALQLVTFFVQGTKIQLHEDLIETIIHHIISDKFFNHVALRIPALMCLMAIAANRNGSKGMSIQICKNVLIKLNEGIRNSITSKPRKLNLNEEKSICDLTRALCAFLQHHTVMVDFLACREVLEESFECLFDITKIGGSTISLISMNYWNSLVAQLIRPPRDIFTKHRLFYKPVLNKILTNLKTQMEVPSQFLRKIRTHAEFCKNYEDLIGFIKSIKTKASCPSFYVAQKLCLLNLVQLERLDAMKLQNERVVCLRS